MPAKRRLLWWAIALALACWIVIHFTLMSVYIYSTNARLPANPISGALRAVAQAYTRPVFDQHWQLFAPNPASENLKVYARGTFRDGEGTKKTPWINFTDRVDRVHWRLHHPVLPAARRFRQDVAPLSGAGDEQGRLDERERRLEELADPSRQPASLIVLQGGGASALAETYPALEFQGVEIMLLVSPLPRFHERHRSESETAPGVITLGRIPFEMAAPWGPGR
jgi:hypothetical protein